uniref:Secreted protein n=1 Tax=Parascaris univalens TaxID=6257 RepID=A0A915BZ75_PARUN
NILLYFITLYLITLNFVNTKQADDNVNKLAIRDYTFYRETHKIKAFAHARSEHVHKHVSNQRCRPLQSYANAKHLCLTPLTSLPAGWQSFTRRWQRRLDEDLVLFP